MIKIALNKLKYDELQILQDYFQMAVAQQISDITYPEKATVLAVIGELWIKIAKKTTYAQRTKLFSISLTPSEALAYIAYIQYVQVSNTHSAIVINDIKEKIIKQLQ